MRLIERALQFVSTHDKVKLISSLEGDGSSISSADLLLVILTQDWLSSETCQAELEQFDSRFPSWQALSSRLVVVKAADVDERPLPRQLAASPFVTLSVTGEGIANASWSDAQAIGEALNNASEKLGPDRTGAGIEKRRNDAYVEVSRLPGDAVTRLPDAVTDNNYSGGLHGDGNVLNGPTWRAVPSPASVAKTPSSPNYAVRRVYFATDRAAGDKTRGTSGSQSFGAARAEGGKLSYGHCDVSIPRIHKMGHLETPSIWRLEFRANPRKHVAILSREVVAQPSDFYELLKADSQVNSSAFVFVHGFNATFDNAVKRTGQLAYDLGFAGLAIAYSWPSKGESIAYTLDDNNVEWTVPHLEEFLTNLQSIGVKDVHVIAHSMGNRAVSRSLASLKLQNPEARFTNIVLAAPDIDRDVFLQLAPAIASKAKVVTLYASDRDKALMASKKLNGYPRAGDVAGGIAIYSGIVSVDVSLVNTEFVGHGYYAGNTSVIADLYYLLRGEPPPRFRLRQATQPAGSYWRFVP